MSIMQAYTTVNARTSLTRPPPPPPPATSSATKTMWPQAVRDYVSRAFMEDKLIVGIDHAQMSKKLKEVISHAADNNMVEMIDWTTYPLPQELIQAERAATLGFIPGLPAHISSVTLDAGSRKRKSPEPEVAGVQSVTPPWRQQQRGTLGDRMDFSSQSSRADKKQKKADEFRSTAGPSKFNDLEKRRQRFEGMLANSSSGGGFHHDSPASLPDIGPVVGTSTSLEKQYFRLTAPPKAETVRPLGVLKRTIEHLIQKWKTEHNYAYICDQFKSMRQDLTVQHIKNEFTVRVYEAHARIALEKGDLGEYNQCQTQLRALYRQNLGGRPGEFTAYRILYFLHTCNRTGMNDLLADLTLIDKQHPAIQHALSVRSALARGNYHRFFRLYEDPPNMGGYLMDRFVERERCAAMAAVCRAYKPDVKVEFLTSELGFADDQQCAQFLCDVGGEALLEKRADGPRFLTGKGYGAFEAARQKAFAVVDIKGQI